MPDPTRCDFCLRPSKECDVLVADSNASICGDCVHLAVRAVREFRETRLSARPSLEIIPQERE